MLYPPSIPRHLKSDKGKSPIFTRLDSHTLQTPKLCFHVLGHRIFTEVGSGKEEGGGRSVRAPGVHPDHCPQALHRAQSCTSTHLIRHTHTHTTHTHAQHQRAAYHIFGATPNGRPKTTSLVWVQLSGNTAGRGGPPSNSPRSAVAGERKGRISQGAAGDPAERGGPTFVIGDFLLLCSHVCEQAAGLTAPTITSSLVGQKDSCMKRQ